jgi:hypothetical protein
VRECDGQPIGRISLDFANALLASGYAERVGRNKLRYLRLNRGIVVTKPSHGWKVLERQRMKYGDDLVRAMLIHLDKRSEYFTNRSR